MTVGGNVNDAVGHHSVVDAADKDDLAIIVEQVDAGPSQLAIKEINAGVYAFDTASSTEWAYPRTFIPDTWIDISATLDAKLAAMACYESELRPYPHPRSLQALEYRARAFGNQVCMEAAEVSYPRFMDDVATLM